MKSKIFYALSFLLVVSSASAQLFKSDKTTTETTDKEKTTEVVEEVVEEKKELKSKNDTASKAAIKADPFLGYGGRSALALNLSSVGIGLEYAHNLNRHLNARLRVSAFTISDFGQAMELGGSPTFVILNADITNADLLLEYLPFSKSSFKLIGGASIIFQGKGTVNVAYDDVIKYGDITITQEEIGDITIGVDYAGVAPYLGFGFGRAVPKNRIGFGLEIGTYYVGSPDVTVEATEMLAETAQEQETLQNNLSDYKWFPFINLRLAVKL